MIPISPLVLKLFSQMIPEPDYAPYQISWIAFSELQVTPVACFTKMD